MLFELYEKIVSFANENLQPYLMDEDDRYHFMIPAYVEDEMSVVDSYSCQNYRSIREIFGQFCWDVLTPYMLG